ncbi:MAG: hypothetical protein ACYDHH_12905 [Solirubrobacteraceae bacterium]
MPARSMLASARAPGREQARPRTRWRMLFKAGPRFTRSTEQARIQARVDAARAEHQMRYLRAGGRRWS